MFVKATGPRAPLTPPLGGPWLTTEERLRDIERMREQINAYALFVCQVGSLKGSSLEAKEKAITAFHERMVVLERQLGHIVEEQRLG
jgi:hypothetical protein